MSGRQAASAGLLVAVLLAYPFVDHALQAQTVYAVTDGMIYVLLALGLNIVVGYAGLLDLGYAAFFAVGAYAMGLLNSPVLGSPLYGHAWSFWIIIWISALVSAALGLLIGAPTLRVRGDYLAIITLGFGEIIPVFIRNLGDVNIEIGSWKPMSLTIDVSATTSIGTSPRMAQTIPSVPTAIVMASSAPDHRITGPIGFSGTFEVSSAPTNTKANTIRENIPVHRRSASPLG